MPLARVLVRVLATLAPMVVIGGGIGDLVEEPLDVLEGDRTLNLGGLGGKKSSKQERGTGG